MVLPCSIKVAKEGKGFLKRQDLANELREFDKIN